MTSSPMTWERLSSVAPSMERAALAERAPSADERSGLRALLPSRDIEASNMAATADRPPDRDCTLTFVARATKYQPSATSS